MRIVHLVHLAWLAFVLVWIVSALFTKSTVHTQAFTSRLAQRAVIGAGGLLVFSGFVPFFWPGIRVVPATPAAGSLGLALLLIGILFAFWARFFLGGNWSSDVTIKEDHTLIRSGPYRIVRHPIYTGILLALLGTAIVFGELRCFVGVAIAVAGLKLKSLAEETLMRQQFGGQYTAYQQEVKALVPWLW